MAQSSAKNNKAHRYRIRKAVVGDVVSIRELVNFYASQGLMLHRSLNEIYECLRDYWVCEKEGSVVACVALHVDWEDLAEVRSLAVAERHHHKGIGTRLLRRCIREAIEIGVTKVFALTYVPGFFQKHGFQGYAKEDLPRKIWSECIRCHKFPDCDETALMLDV